MITGKINSIPNKTGRPANWCFIRGDDGADYFLHNTELFNNWEEMKARLALSGSVPVEFETTMGEKGLRAVGCKIVD